MSTTGSLTDTDAWNRLSLYRERYDIEDRLDAVSRLERSIRRRRFRLDATEQRVNELEEMLAESRHQAEVLSREIAESRRIGLLLIDELIEKVRNDLGEAWTPRAIRGFRMWRVKPGGLHGATNVHWSSPTMEATCLRSVPLEDVPHREARCGPPACGIYTTKRLEDLDPGKAGWLGTDQAVGVVAMSGKVVEHDNGYRAARATVVAIAVRWAMRWMTTSEPEVIEALFADTLNTILAHGTTDQPVGSRVEEFLTASKKEDESWI